MNRLPSDSDLIAYINEHAGEKLGKRELARAFGVRGDLRVDFKKQLKSLEDQGLINFRRKRVAKADALPPTVFVRFSNLDDNGDLIGSVELGKDGPARASARKICVRDGKPQQGKTIAGIGDAAIVTIVSQGDADNLPLGKIIRVLPKRDDRELGIFRPEGAHGIITPTQDKSGHEHPVLLADSMDAQDGDLVVFSLEKSSPRARPFAHIVEKLGNPKSEKAISLIALHHHKIPIEFEKNVLEEAETAAAPSTGTREDWRDIPLITIDPHDAKDHDDAVAARPDAAADNNGGWVVDVAIADVAHFVRPSGAMDEAAAQRGNSVYFPDRVVPMLPEKISNNLCSLRPDEDRSALCIRMRFNADGHKVGQSLHRILMRSHARLSYEQAQKAADGVPNIVSNDILESAIKPLWMAYEALGRARDGRGPLALDLPERKILLNEDGLVDQVITPERLDAHKLIEECMIQANVAAAELLEAKAQPGIYRCHDTPSLEKIEGLKDLLDGVGLSLPKGARIKAHQLNRILSAVQGKDAADLINESILRSQAQAIYTPDNFGHFGLNLPSYVHFTSPIRRYADLCVHRALISAYKLGDDGLPPYGSDKFNKISEDISNFERRAMRAERDTVDRLIAAFLSDQVGAVFPARISGVSKSGLLLRLDYTGADGFVPIKMLDTDYFIHDEKNMRLVGADTNIAFQIGDRVTAKLVEVGPVSGAIRLEIVKGGQRLSLSKRERAELKMRPMRGHPRSRSKPISSRGPRTHKGESSGRSPRQRSK